MYLRVQLDTLVKQLIWYVNNVQPDVINVLLTRILTQKFVIFVLWDIIREKVRLIVQQHVLTEHLEIQSQEYVKHVILHV